MTTTILFRPNAEYREAILGDGVCGARMPVVFVPPPGHSIHKQPVPAAYITGPHRTLALVWHGVCIIKERKERENDPQADDRSPHLHPHR